MNPSSGSPDPFELPVLPAGELEGQIRDASVPLLVDFFATWCGPCAWIVPTLRALAREHGEALRVVKVDTDEDSEVTTRHAIGSVPTVVLFHRGKEVGRSVGVEPERVRAMVEAELHRG